MIALSIGLLIFSGIFLLLRRSYICIVFGLIILSNGINLALFYGSSPKNALFAFIATGDAVQVSNDPLPQALVLTAIVIGFALIGFLVALVRIVARDLGPFGSPDMMREEADE